MYTYHVNDYLDYRFSLKEWSGNVNIEKKYAE